MEPRALEYYERREHAERAAAQAATCPQARRAHEQLAEHYRCVMLLNGDVPRATEGDTAKSHFIVLTSG